MDHLKGVRSELMNSAQNLIEDQCIKRLQAATSPPVRERQTYQQQQQDQQEQQQEKDLLGLCWSAGLGNRRSQHEDHSEALDGEWRAQISGCRVTILGGMLNWPGTAQLQMIQPEANGLSVELNGMRHRAEFTADGTRLLWDDGDIWTRQKDEFARTGVGQTK